MPSIRKVGEATLTESSAPTLCYSMDVNALNYCRFSLLTPSPDIEEELTVLLAVPNLVESSLVRAHYTDVLATEANNQHRRIYGRCPVCRDYMLQLVTLRIPPPPCSPMVDLVLRQVIPVSFTGCNDSTPRAQVSSWPCICFMHSKSFPPRPQHQESYVSSAHMKMEASPFVGAWPYQEFGQ